MPSTNFYRPGERVKALQWLGDNIDELYAFGVAPSNFIRSKSEFASTIRLNGVDWVRVHKTDWLVMTLSRGVVLMEDDTFREFFMEVPDRLHHREQEMLEGLAKGWTNEQIARALFLSPQTVKTWLGRLYRTLEVHDRGRAVALGFEEGYLV
jgi:DNA-binding CsgD family transcriptional regulator